MALGEMRTMGPAGDVKIIWDSDKIREVDSARKQFNELTRSGYAAYKVDKRGAQGEQIKEFDPQAEKIILVPAHEGG